MNYSKQFITALKQNDLQTLRSIPKTDFHNHFVLGGSRSYIKQKTGYDIRPIKEPINSMDEVQHGIAAASSKETMEYLRKHHITLNITPTSNLLLGRVSSMKEHPIAKLYHEGVDVTINSDDILMFDSAVSKEYLALYQNEVLTAEELNEIRIKSLQK